MFGIVQQGSESCELLLGNALVIVHIPIRITGQAPTPDANLRYRIGAFWGRETKLLFLGQEEITLTFRIPQEHFKESERLTLEAYVASKEGEERVLWTAQYTVGWQDTAHQLKPFLQLCKDWPT